MSPTRTVRCATSAALVLLAVLAAVPACDDASGVGDPCVPELEHEASFNGFDEQSEVYVESKSFQCRTRLCLVNHFRGRVSCPYGQDRGGRSPDGVQGPNREGCVLPGTSDPVVGKGSRRVEPQCAGRPAAEAVYCSCRCANADGRTDDGAVYCACPEGFTCESIYPKSGLGNEGLTGSYCIKNGTRYDRNGDSCGLDCDPVVRPCEGG